MYTSILWLCAGLAGLVFGVMLYSLATFRRSVGAGAAGRRRSPVVEVLWALVPIVILFGAAAPAVRTMIDAEADAFQTFAERLNSP